MASAILHTIIPNTCTTLPSASTYWQTTSFETWPLRSPFVNFAAPPAAAQPGAEKLVAEAPKDVTPYGAYLAQPEKLTAANEASATQVPQPQAAIANLTPYGAAHGNLLLLNSPYYAAYSLPLAYVAPSVAPVAPTIAHVAPSVAPAPSSTTSTAKPTTAAEVEDVESAEQDVDTIETLQKLQAKTQTATGDLRSDARMRAAVSRINSNYVIEEIIAVPGKHVLSSQTKSSARLASSQTKNYARLSQPQLKSKPKATGAKLRKGSNKVQQAQQVKVEATGRTSSSSNNFPQIPFGTFFLPYRPQQAKAIQERKQAALILEPHSKAVVGNGGTAISTPISRALLKKGVPTNVYFNPESVAIAGVGGKAHAAADLELDLFN